VSNPLLCYCPRFSSDKCCIVPRTLAVKEAERTQVTFK